MSCVALCAAKFQLTSPKTQSNSIDKNVPADIINEKFVHARKIPRKDLIQKVSGNPGKDSTAYCPSAYVVTNCNCSAGPCGIRLAKDYCTAFAHHGGIFVQAMAECTDFGSPAEVQLIHKQFTPPSYSGPKPFDITCPTDFKVTTCNSAINLINSPFGQPPLLPSTTNSYGRGKIDGRKCSAQCSYPMQSCDLYVKCLRRVDLPEIVPHATDSRLEKALKDFHDPGRDHRENLWVVISGQSSKPPQKYESFANCPAGYILTKCHCNESNCGSHSTKTFCKVVAPMWLQTPVRALARCVMFESVVDIHYNTQTFTPPSGSSALFYVSCLETHKLLSCNVMTEFSSSDNGNYGLGQEEQTTTDRCSYVCKKQCKISVICIRDFYVSHSESSNAVTTYNRRMSRDSIAGSLSSVSGYAIEKKTECPSGRVLTKCSCSPSCDSVSPTLKSCTGASTHSNINITADCAQFPPNRTDVMQMTNSTSTDSLMFIHCPENYTILLCHLAKSSAAIETTEFVKMHKKCWARCSTGDCELRATCIRYVTELE